MISRPRSSPPPMEIFTPSPQEYQDNLSFLLSTGQAQATPARILLGFFINTLLGCPLSRSFTWSPLTVLDTASPKVKNSLSETIPCSFSDRSFSSLTTNTSLPCTGDPKEEQQSSMQSTKTQISVNFWLWIGRSAATFKDSTNSKFQLFSPTTSKMKDIPSNRVNFSIKKWRMPNFTPTEVVSILIGFQTTFGTKCSVSLTNMEKTKWKEKLISNAKVTRRANLIQNSGQILMGKRSRSISLSKGTINS